MPAATVSPSAPPADLAPVKVRDGSPNLRERRDGPRAVGIAILAIGTAIALFVRFCGQDFQTGDYYWFTGPWYAYIQDHGGFAALRDSFSEYTPSYLNLLVLTYYLLPGVKAITAVKLVSVVFDLVCAWLTYRIVALRHPSGNAPSLAAIAVLLAPTVVINSSVWGQADSIYAAGLLACVYLIATDHPTAAVGAFGLALATKLQALFLAPFLIALLVSGRIRWRHLLAIPASILLTILPTWIAGRDLVDILTTYLRQSEHYSALSMNAPTIYQWITNDAYATAYPVGLVGAALVMLGSSALVGRRKARLDSRALIALATASVLVFPYLTPKMHDRYFFPADILSIIFAFYFPEFFAVPIVVGMVSLMSYGPFLLGVTALPFWYLPLALLPAILVVGWQLSRLIRRDRPESPARSKERIATRIAFSLVLLALVLVPLAPQLPAAVSTLIPPPRATDAEMAAIAHRVDVSFGDLRLVGYGPAQPQVDPAGNLKIDLYWEKQGTVVDSRSVVVHLLDDDRKPLAESKGNWPILWWRLADPVRETREISVGQTSEPTTEIISVSVEGPAGLPYEARDGDGTALGESVDIGHFKRGVVTFAPIPGASEPGLAIFGREVALVGSGVDERQVRNGSFLRGRLVWQALNRVDTDYTVFVQLVGRQGLAAQSDSQPRGGSYPTSWWEIGEVVHDSFAVPVGQCPPGEYQLIAGLYDLRSGRRLPVGTADYVDLGRVTVVE